jgi:alkylation response protein AidB-like acyl-CoA dehydrogenase
MARINQPGDPTPPARGDQPERSVQPAPAPPDPYIGDPVLRSWLDRLLGDDGHAAAAPRLAALAAEVGGPLREAHADAEAHPPRLVSYDGWGARIDLVQTAPGWERLRRAAAEHAVVALPYLDDARQRWGAGARVVQHALLHLYGPESATFTCPAAMADGAAALLSRPDIDGDIRDAWLPRLVSTDPGVAVTSGQWMTESQGGSDISRTSTVAEHTDRGWRITGEKWFCSAIDSAMAVALARPEGAGPGSRNLAPFLIPRYADGVVLHRLKDKLGTRAVPTAEVGLRGVAAFPLGDPGQPGLARMMTLVVVTRLHNAAAAAAGMRRGLAYARSYADLRTVASGRLSENPLHRATLGQLAVDVHAAFALAAHGFALLGRLEVDGDEAAAEELRLVAPLAKLTTGRLAVASASEYLECFGGAGYVEDTGIPRLLRDAQVLPIWEGTTNVLAVDVLRALASSGAKPLQHRVAAACDAAAARLPRAADTLVAAARRLGDDAATAAADPGSPAVLAGARALALRMGYLLAAALLVEHAGWAADRGEESPGVAAALWTLHRMGGADIADEAHRYFEALA